MTYNFELCNQLLDDSWRELVANAIDATPDEQDFADWYSLGQLDYSDSLYNPPANRPAFDDYLRGQNDAWAQANQRTLLR